MAGVEHPDWSEFKALISQYSSFVICSHVRPDADALGAELGMQYLLQKLGKTARIVNASGIPANLSFIADGNEILQLNVDVQKQQFEIPDAFLTVDTSSWQQLGGMADVIRSSNRPHFCVDHHLVSDDLGPHVFRNTSAAAAGEMVFQIFEACQIQPDSVTAGYLYAAIATDTGWFRFPSTSQETMRIAGRLIEYGAVPHEVYRLVHEQHSLERLRLSGRVLQGMNSDYDGRLNWLVVSAADLEATGTSPADTEGLVNRCLTVASAEVAFIAVELPTTQIKCSFRCRPPHNVASLAATFSGGGHQLASGCTLSGPLETALERILNATGRMLSEGAAQK